MEANAPHGERVLVVEDEYLIRLALCDGLSLHGFHVIAAEMRSNPIVAFR